MAMTASLRIISVITIYWIVSWEAIFLNKCDEVRVGE